MRLIEKLKSHIESMIGDEEKVEKVVNVAAGVIMKEGDNGEPMVLLIKRAKDDHWPLHYEFPRGKCDQGKNEDIHKCLHREIKEETGLDIIIESFLGKFIYYAEKGKRKSICFNYLCRMKNPNQKVKLSFEHQSYKWITQAGEAELLVHPDQKRFIDQVLSQENPIKNTPENNFTMNNSVEEYLNRLQETHPMHRRRAIRKRIEILNKKRNECKSKRDPNTCKMKYDKEISKLRAKLDKLSNLKV